MRNNPTVPKKTNPFTLTPGIHVPRLGYDITSRVTWLARRVHSSGPWSASDRHRNFPKCKSLRSYNRSGFVSQLEHGKRDVKLTCIETQQHLAVEFMSGTLNGRCPHLFSNPTQTDSVQADTHDSTRIPQSWSKRVYYSLNVKELNHSICNKTQASTHLLLSHYSNHNIYSKQFIFIANTYTVDKMWYTCSKTSF